MTYQHNFVFFALLDFFFKLSEFDIGFFKEHVSDGTLLPRFNLELGLLFFYAQACHQVCF